jgi:YVTN family beta-propeller protein
LYITHFWSGDVSLIYLPTNQVVSTISTGLDTGLSQSIDIDLTRGLAYIPQTRSNAQNRALTFDTVVFPVVNVLDLRDLSNQQQERIALDIIDQPVNMPFAVAVDRFREWLYVANAGSNDVTAINLADGTLRGHVEVDANPRGLLLNPENTLLYVHNALDGTLTTIDTNTLQIIDSLPISNLTIPVDILIGAQLFYTAEDTRLAADRRVSCANCHFDGLPDGRTWLGFADGPRNTPPLFNLLETAPYNWSGTWDELADAELKIRGLQAGTGLVEGEVLPPLGDPHAGLSLDLDTLTLYLTTLQEPANPTQPDAQLLERGAAIFQEQGCAECHAGPAGTTVELFDVGTALSPLEQAGAAFNTPTLRGLWMSAPYLHDGSAETLRDVFSAPGMHQLVMEIPPEDIDALMAYLLAWPPATP